MYRYRMSRLFVAAVVALVAQFCSMSSTASALDPIQLVPSIDTIGQQIPTVQVYNPGDGKGDRITYSIYDTGASVVTYGHQDLSGFASLGQAIDVKVPNGAQASGLGGILTGDISVWILISAALRFWIRLSTRMRSRPPSQGFRRSWATRRPVRIFQRFPALRFMRTTWRRASICLVTVSILTNFFPA